MTRWTIDGRGLCGLRAVHYTSAGRFVYNVQEVRGSAAVGAPRWLSEVDLPDGTRKVIDDTESTRAGACARCEYHAANRLEEEAS